MNINRASHLTYFLAVVTSLYLIKLKIESSRRPHLNEEMNAVKYLA